MLDLTSAQKKTVIAAFLGWMLDAFDFFLLVFLLGDIAKEFDVEVSDVAYAVFLTLAMRFVGAFIFGRLGDRFGRKPMLMLDIVSYSVIGASRPSRRAFGYSWCCGRCSASRWAANGASAVRSPWKSIPPKARGAGVGHFAVRLSHRLSACLGRLRFALSARLRRLYLRLARDVPAQRSSRASSCCSSARTCRNLPAFAEAQKVPSRG